MLAPAGYYQSLRLIPSIFGGEIHVTSELTGETVSRWLAETADHSRRCVYVPLVNNVDGWVLTNARARSIARAVLKHNAARRSRPVYVLADDVYAGSYLSPDCEGVPIAVMSGADVGDPALGRMSDWTLSVITASKTFALPTARVAFATSTNPALLSAVGQYRTVLSQGRVPQVTELTAAAALSFTPQSWIDAWNSRYRAALADLTARISAINAEAGLVAYQVGAPEGGWYLPLRVAPSLMPGAASSVDAFAVLLHYGAEARNTGIAMLPGGLFGYRNDGDGFVLRGTLAVPADDLCRFTGRLRDAVVRLTGPGGPELVAQAMKRARGVADVDAILASCRY
jgi:aspartate/methionine/tyrosine aminotransferase